MIKQLISDYVDQHLEEVVADTSRLIRIDSSNAPALQGKPFGEGAAKALEEALAIIESYGFKTTNYDNYVITADMNEEEKALDILAHLDVVPAGEGWTVTEPFEPIVIDGKLFGRGSIDDKGPAMAALLAMRAVRDLKLPITKNVRLILGANEECGSEDIAYYFKKEPFAPMTFSPDADFPLINIEKGSLGGRFTGKYLENKAIPMLKAFHGGHTSNVVPNKAYAVVCGMPAKELAKAEARAKELGVQISFEGEEEVTIRVEGVSAHASLPEKGNNAVTALIDVLSQMAFADGGAMALIRELGKIFPHGDTCGEAAGVKMSDELSGALTMTLDILDVENGSLRGVFDSRAPICATEENLYLVMKNRLEAANLYFDADVKMNPPHYADGNSEFVRTLLACYETYSGKKGEAKAIGGGTYVHHIENGVAFGCEVEGIDNHLHGADEFIGLDVLAMSAKIFALSIAELCK